MVASREEPVSTKVPPCQDRLRYRFKHLQKFKKHCLVAKGYRRRREVRIDGYIRFSIMSTNLLLLRSVVSLFLVLSLLRTDGKEHKKHRK
jgi:hypothetical protein